MAGVGDGPEEGEQFTGTQTGTQGRRIDRQRTKSHGGEPHCHPDRFGDLSAQEQGSQQRSDDDVEARDEPIDRCRRTRQSKSLQNLASAEEEAEDDSAANRLP